MPTILIIGTSALCLEKLARSAHEAGAQATSYLVGMDCIQSLRRNHDYDVISVVTEKDTGTILIQKVIDLLNELKFKGVLIHYWGHSPIGDLQMKMPFRFAELMRQCYGSPESPLTEWWASFCMDAYRKHLQKGDS